MSRKLERLIEKRHQNLEKQSAAIRLIIEKSVDPQLTGTLVNDLMTSVSQDRELVLAISAEIEKSRMYWWSRYLQGS